jgi:hypothetical protein
VRANAPLARRIYALLLHLYPPTFRRDYADELTLLFDDLRRAAAAQGAAALARLWLAVLLDLFVTVLGERRRTMPRPAWATVISLALFLPIVALFGMATVNYDPPFARQFFNLMVTPDDHLNTFGRIFELYLIMSTPIAFLTILLSMLRRADSEQAARFIPTRSSVIIGFFILIVVSIVFSPRMFDDELWQAASSLASAPFLAQVVCLLVFLPLPALFLLGRLPRLTTVATRGALIFQPTSSKLIIGAALFLVVLMEMSSFILAATACSIGLPNCD